MWSTEVSCPLKVPPAWHDLCVRWRKMTHFSKQTLLWHRIRGHPLTSWSWSFSKQASSYTTICIYMHVQTYTLFDANCTVISAWFELLTRTLSFSSCDSTHMSHRSRSVCHPLPSQGLYCDIRQLVQFIKEAHGNVFRRVALSALLDSAEKVTTTKKPEEKEDTKQPGPRRYWPVSGQKWSQKMSNWVVTK